MKNAALEAQSGQPPQVGARPGLSHLLAASLNEIYLFDAETLLFRDVSKGAQQNLGYPLGHLRGLTPLDITPAVTESAFRDLTGPLLRREKAQLIFETVHRRADATHYPVEIHLQLVEREADRVFLAVVLDQTARQQTDAAREQLAESAAQLRIAGRVARLGGWRIELPERRLTWSEETGAIHEFPPGYQPALEEAIGFYPPEARAEVFRHVKACEEQGTPYDFEVPKITAEGRRIWVRSIGEAVRDAAGKTIRLQGAFQDITERRKGQEALRESEREFRALAESMPQMVWKCRPDGWIVYVNQRWLEYTGRTLEESSGSGWSRPFHPQDRPLAEKAWNDATEHGTDYSLEARLRDRLGDYRWFLVRGVPQRDDAGTILGWFGTCTDINERKLAETERNETNQRLVETSHQAGMAEVATSVLHNVGNVLNSVNISATLAAEKIRRSGGSDLTRLAALLEEHRHDLPGFLASAPGSHLPDFLTGLARNLAAEHSTVLAELESLGSHIEHIKEIVSMQQSYARRGGVIETIAPASLVEDALRLKAAALQRHRVSLVRELAEVPPLKVDKHKVLQILVNLIRNVQGAMAEPGARGSRLTIAIGHGAPGFGRISVSDEGAGIPAGNRTRIFEHGFTTRSDGHGFGLHSAALAARELGGALTAHSEGFGMGSTFTLELPLTPLRFP